MDEAILAAAQRVRAAGLSPPRPARDPVNLPMIRNWTEAIGDANPVYTDAAAAAASVHQGLVAPPAMVQVWTMRGLHPLPDPDDPLALMSAALDQAGYTSVVATNCDQVYHRYLRHGEQLTISTELLDVIGPKRTALGEGWFVTTRSTWFSADEPVATMDFRVLKFKPPEPAGDGTHARDPANASSPPPLPAPVQTDQGIMRPPVSPDTAFFWAGTAAGELRIQECGECGALRHPPGPVCRECGADKPGYRIAAGTGEVFSYVVHRHPPVPGKQLPIVIALVQLTEGVRMLGELHGIEPEQVSIGLPVQVQFTRIDDELTLPGWRPAPAPGQLPELAVKVTPTVVVSTAIATRDFQDVHHDRDLAVLRGSKDIFLNILSTTGLVQRYVTDWAGQEAIVRSITIRLGAPCYAGDTLTFTGELAESPPGEQVISVTGNCSLGKHVTATVTLAADRSQP